MWTLHFCVCLCMCLNISIQKSRFSWKHFKFNHFNGEEIFVTEGALHRSVCVYVNMCVRAIQISFWSPRKPEINRSQSVFRRLDRQFCFKTSKHHLYSTFRAHKCLSDIYERRRKSVRRGKERERREGAPKRRERRAGEKRSIFDFRKRCGATPKDRWMESDGTMEG